MKPMLAVGLASAGLAAAVAACRGGPAEPEPPAILAFAVVNAPSFVAKITITVKGAGIPDSVVRTVPITMGAASDTVKVQAGANRLIIARAYDSSNVSTHRADTTVNLVPGLNPTLRLVLQPLTGSLPIDITFGVPERILFVSDRGAPRPGIWIMKSDGTGLTKLTTDTTISELAAEPSPDGRTIAFVRAPNLANPVGSRLWTMRIDGTGRFLVDSTGGGSSGIAWAPDGSEIVYQSSVTCGEDLLAIRPDGTGRRVFLDAGVHIPEPVARHPSWSALSKVAFDGTFCQRFLGIGKLYIMTPDRSGLTFVTDSVLQARWSPDGSKLVMSRVVGTRYQIWIMQADGSGPAPLTSDTLGGHWPAWSPDGSQIVFLRTNGLWIMNANGTGLRQLTTYAGDNRPVWLRIP